MQDEQHQQDATVKPVIVITGPTASGKTATALALARRMGGEIISADSMQVYREMDVGTAKTPADQRQDVPHHLLDIRNPGERFSVADFLDLASKAIRAVYRQGRWPIVCGGTGQYISALVKGLELPAAPADVQLRARLQEQADREGLARLHQQLALQDPEAAQRISPHDQKRIIRALELIELTGKPQNEHHRASRLKGPDFNFICYCLTHDRPVLYARINQRVLDMVKNGLAEEVIRLIQKGLPADSLCFQAIGYKEMMAYLAGEADLAQTIVNIQQATRRYAKRQLTWFRHMDGLIWLENHEALENTEIILDDLRKFGFIQ